MALEQVSGPHPLLLETSIPFYYAENPMWLDDYGLCGHVTSTAVPSGQSFHFTIAQLGGLAYVRNSYAHPSHMGDMAWNQQTGRLLWHSRWNIPAYNYDPMIGHPEGGAHDGKTGKVQEVLLNDRGLRATTNGSQIFIHVRDLATGVITEETRFSTAGGAGNPTGTGVIGPAGDGTLAITFSSGHLFKYDPITKKQVGNSVSTGMVGKYLFYSPKFDVLIGVYEISGSTNQEIRIRGSETTPNGLSNPAALTPITRGQSSTIQVRLTGDLGEAVPGMLVDWTLTGTGSLTLTQSVTDADGYAETQYIAPNSFDDAVNIQAEVTH